MRCHELYPYADEDESIVMSFDGTAEKFEYQHMYDCFIPRVFVLCLRSTKALKSFVISFSTLVRMSSQMICRCEERIGNKPIELM